MRIRQRVNREWCMEHRGAEAPYIVEVDIDGAFSVYDIEDEDEDRARPIAARLDREAAEALALAHFRASSPLAPDSTTPFGETMLMKEMGNWFFGTMFALVIAQGTQTAAEWWTGKIENAITTAHAAGFTGLLLVVGYTIASISCSLMRGRPTSASE